MLTLLVPLAARAADVTLVAAGDPALARARLAAALAVPEDQIRVVALAEALPTASLVPVGGGRVEACDVAPTTNAEVRQAVEAAERHVAYVEHDQALTRLDEAAGRLVCLSEPVEPAVAARIHFLHGVVAHGKGDSATAEAAFRQAFAYVPDLRWDDTFPPDPKPLFEAAAVSKAAPSELAVVPPPASLYVDGQVKPARASLAPGVHLVQFGAPLVTRRVFVDTGASVGLVSPALVPADALKTWTADPALRADLAYVLGAAFGPGVKVYVDDTESTWSTTTAGSTEWSAVAGVAAERPEPTTSDAATPNLATTTDAAALVTSVASVIESTHEQAFDEGKRGGKRTLGLGLMAGGAAIVAGGGILAGVNYGAVHGDVTRAEDAVGNNDFTAYEEASVAYERHRSLFGAGLTVAAVGVGAAAGGLVAFLDVGPGYGGAGVQVRW